VSSRTSAHSKKNKTRAAERKTAVTSTDGSRLALIRDSAGWLIVSVCLVSGLALFSSVYGGSGENWMGPYLGTALAKLLQILFGRFPVLLVLVAALSTGVWLLSRGLVPWLGRLLIGIWSVYLFVSILLTLRISDLPAHFEIHFENNAGMTGLFIVRNVIEPVFGQAKVGPVLFSILGLGATAFFCFGLRAHHLAFLKHAFLTLVQWARTHIHLPAQGIRLPTFPGKAAHAPVPHDADTGDFAVIRKGEVTPFKGPVGKLDRSRARKDASKIGDSSQILPMGTPPQPGPETVDAIKAIEARLALATDPREVRSLRDELADLRRIQGINDWEDDRAGELRIEGMVRRPAGAAEPVQHAPAPEPTLPPEPALPKVEPMELLAEEKTATEYEVYRVPRIDAILPVPPVQEVDYSELELQEISRSLEVQLENFRVKGKVTGIATGPVITRFEIEPGPGVKVARFAGLSDDLALALRASAIRVLAPIPGKSVVGIEIPNRKAQTIFCRDILESPRFAPKPENIQIVLGKDITGNAFVMDLARAPHILIAGQTGSGKSVCINVLMASILLSKSPDDLRMILVDPKVVELKMYEKIPHLLHPVVTQPEVAVQALKWACIEMDRRYTVLAEAKVRNIAGYNTKVKEGQPIRDITEYNQSVKDGTVFVGKGEAPPEKMPFIVIVIDELADLMMVAGKEVETSIARIAQKARAVGIHLVLATQRPSVNVITGLIKANLPTRISFKVASHIDARTVLDKAGAEKLLGRGDMLFRATEDPEPNRVHGAFLSDTEAEALAKACSDQNVNYPQLATFEVAEPGLEDPEEGGGDPAQLDSLFFEAAELGVASGGISTSMVQRRFQVGYSRAGRIVDQMERMGICSRANGSKPRNMLVDEEQLMNLMRTWNR